MKIPTRWRDIKTSMRVVDPAGQVFHALAPSGFPGVRQVRDARGRTYAVQAPDDAYVPREYEPKDAAVDILRNHFDLEFLREER